jgi:hypothetical protein
LWPVFSDGLGSAGGALARGRRFAAGTALAPLAARSRSRSCSSGAAEGGGGGAETTGVTAGATPEAASGLADAGGRPEALGARVSAEGSTLECMTARAPATATPATTTNTPPSKAADGRRDRTAGTGVVDMGEAVTAAFADGARETSGACRPDWATPNRVSAPHTSARASQSSAAD